MTYDSVLVGNYG